MSLTSLEESPLTAFIQALWKGRATGMEDVNIGVLLPHTVIYEHNFPKGLFYTTTHGSLQRRTGKEIDSKKVVEIFASTVAQRQRKPAGGSKGARDKVAVGQHHLQLTEEQAKESNIIASYIEKNQEDDTYSVQFFTAEGLKSFLLGATMLEKHSCSIGGVNRKADIEEEKVSTIDVRLVSNKNGLLQQFIYPIGSHNERIQVVWTSHVCLAERVKNTTDLFDGSKTPFQRAATFEGPECFSSRTYVAPRIAEAIRVQCESLVDQIYVVERRVVERMTLYFALDHEENIWLLWCPFIRLAPLEQSPLRRGHETQEGGTMHHRGSQIEKGRRGILPAYSIPSSYTGSILSEDAMTHANRLRKNQLMRITMANSFVSLTEKAFLSENPNVEMQKQWEEKQRLLQAQQMRSPQRRSGRVNASSSGGQQESTISHPHDTLDTTSGSGAGQNENSAFVNSVFEFKTPKIECKCMDAAPKNSTFTLPTKSRLCPKMRWLKHPISLDRPKSSFEKSFSSTESEASRRSSTTPSAQQTPQARFVTPADGKKDAYIKIVYTMNTPSVSLPDSTSATEKEKATGVDLLVSHTSRLPIRSEADEVRALTRQPIHPLLLPTSNTEENSLSLQRPAPTKGTPPPAATNSSEAWFYAQRMTKTKESIEVALDYLESVKETVYSHFLLHEDAPLAVSVPIFLLSCDVVQRSVVSFVAKILPTISIAEAVEMDKSVGRDGVIDDLSHHHSLVGAKGESLVSNTQKAIPCFVMQDSRKSLTFMANLMHFYLVDLRNIHAEMEHSLITSRHGLQQQPASTPSTKGINRQRANSSKHKQSMGKSQSLTPASIGLLSVG